MDGFRLTAENVSALKQQVYDYMLRTRGQKYAAWIKGIKRYGRWVRTAEHYLAPLHVPYAKDASLRIELIEAVYVAMRIVDDVVDKDAPLAEGFSSSVAYTESLINFIDSGRAPSDVVESLLDYAFDIAMRLAIEIRPRVRDMLESLLFDAKRQESSTLQIFSRETLERHFHLLDIRGTIGGCIIVMRGPLGAWETVRSLGEATRIMYTLADLEEDMRANLCNVPLEDVIEFKIRNVCNIDSPQMRKWRQKEVRQAQSLLQLYCEHKQDVRIDALIRTVLFLAYERPARKYLNQMAIELARTT